MHREVENGMPSIQLDAYIPNLSIVFLYKDALAVIDSHLLSFFLEGTMFSCHVQTNYPFVPSVSVYLILYVIEH